MTAAVDLAALPPELLEAIVVQVAAKLALVPPPPPQDAEGLSMLPASIRRRDCERRQADAVRGDRSGDRSQGLSMIPATVRKREWKRREAAAKKAAIDPLPMYLHDEAYEKHATAAPQTDSAGPLAGDVSAIVNRADNRKKLELARVYGVIREGLFKGSGGRIRLPRWWAKAPSEWEDGRKLLANFGIQQIRAAAVSLGETWKPSKEFPRPTVGLILWRLEVWRAGTRPAKRADSRRLSGEDLEERDRARARAAAPARPAHGISPKPAHSEAPAERKVSPNPAHGTTPAPSAPVQIAEPSPASSAEALAVLELVNETAARCRAFRGRP